MKILEEVMSLERDKSEYVKLLEVIKNDYNNYPDNLRILNDLWLLEAAVEDFDAAILYLKELINLDKSAKLYSNLAELYIKKNDYENAEINCKLAIDLDKNNYNAWFFLGYIYKKTDKIDKSIKAYKKALKINPESAEIYHNLGNIYQQLKNDPASVLVCYKEYLKYDCGNIAAKSSLGGLYLKLKKYKIGWKYYNYTVIQAMKNCEFSLKSFLDLKKFWSGEDIKDKTLFVYFDGGLGDTIMFSRFLPLLKSKCKKVLFAAQSSLIDLFKDSDLGVEILDKDFAKEHLHFDYYLPLMSMAYKLKMNDEKDFPSPDGYLKTNPKLVSQYKEKYFDNDKLKIGIKWEGNMRYALERHFNVEQYYKLFWLKNTQFYSLQKGSGIEQLERIKGYDLVDLGSTFNDFRDTAAAIENLDLVISNDTSVAHLAGALGKECWLLLPFVQEWRWSVDTSYCPWYNSFKIFKQTKLNDWDGVFDEVYRCLNERLSNLQISN